MNRQTSSRELSTEVKKALGLHRPVVGYFLERPNRFIVHCEDIEGNFIRAHLPNPGRLHELFFPGTKLFLTRAIDSGKQSKVPRRTSHTVVAVERDGHPVFLHTHDTNTLIEIFLRQKLIPELENFHIIKREAKYGHSRFDFLLEQNETQEQLWLEVKSCTLFGNNIAMFPDAVTARGTRHLEELAQIAAIKTRCAVVIAIHSPDIHYFMPDYLTDLVFSETLLRIKSFVNIIPISVPWNNNLGLTLPIRRVPVPWEYLRREICDQGTIILYTFLAHDSSITVDLETVTLSKGYYLWCDYEGQSVTRKTKILKNSRPGKKISFVEALAQKSTKSIVLPVRGHLNESEEIFHDLKILYPKELPGKRTLYTIHDPLNDQAFHRCIEKYRMKRPVV